MDNYKLMFKWIQKSKRSGVDNAIVKHNIDHGSRHRPILFKNLFLLHQKTSIEYKIVKLLEAGTGENT